MSDKHAEQRDRKWFRERYGMKVSGRSTKTVLILQLDKPRKKKKRKK